MSFETNVVELDQSQLDNLFNETPETTPNADMLELGKEPVIKEEPIVKEHITNNPISDIPEYVEEESEVIEEETKTEDLEKPTDVSSVLKNTVDYLVSQGIWSDFEDRDSLDITEETYAELAAKQAQHQAYEYVNELIDSTGDYGKAIINHIKAGGNPDEIIDIFKEQKQLDSIDTSNEEGKQRKIETYYKDVLGWKSERVQKHLNRLVEADEIDSEFNDVEELYDSYYQEKLAKTQEAAILREKQEEERKQAFTANIKSVLDSDESLTLKEKNQIASSILDFKYKLDNGQKVNEFYVKFAEMQSDPSKYIKLVKFVMDDEGYDNKLKQKESTEANKKLFSFIKGNSTISKNSSSNIEINENAKRQSKKGTDFSFALKK